MRKIFAVLARYLAANRNNKLVNKLYQNLDYFLRKVNNQDFDGETNGELRLMQLLSEYDYKVLFDVGANRGEWITWSVDLFPNASFHAFELVPSTFDLLQSKFGDHPRVKLNPIGLSDFSGEIPIYVGAENEISTAFKVEGSALHEAAYSGRILCEVSSGEAYMLAEGIDEIDFLKIDTEGNDFRVIKGFGESIKKVKVLQFEYGVFNIASKDLLCDFYSYLSQMGFKVGKVFPKHIDFAPYHFDMENFHGGNFLAVRNDQRDLLESLA